jgi:transposase
MTAKWIEYEDPNWNAWECSKCGTVQYLESGTPLENEWFYCPHCGKHLEEEEIKNDR